MKKLSVLTLSLLLTAAMPALADDFGARFGSNSTAALQDTPGDQTAADLQNIAPAAGDAATATDPATSTDPEAAADEEEIGTPDATQPARIETQAGAKPTQPDLQGTSEPEATPQEKTESTVIHYDQGMSPDDDRDASYRLQDTTN